jgi:hypothetical protein
VDRDSELFTPLQEATEKEMIFARVREEPTTIVAAQDHMVGMVRNNEEMSRHTGHAIVID